MLPRPFGSTALRLRTFTRRPAPASLHPRAAPAERDVVRLVVIGGCEHASGGSRRAGGIAGRALSVSPPIGDVFGEHPSATFHGLVQLFALLVESVALGGRG